MFSINGLIMNMPNYKSIYEPKEDSTLLEGYVRQYAFGSVLDIGTGSGIQAIAAAHKSNVNSIIALDIQKGAIDYCKKNIKNNKIKFYYSDLFELFEKNKKFITKKFDTIIFNPPYLPDELKVKDLTIEGGKKGFEIIERFFNEVNNYLNENGIMLIVFSSLTKKSKVDDFIQNNLLEFKLLEKEHVFFEDLYVYLVEKSNLLKKLEKKGIKKIIYFRKGKRGFIYKGVYNNKNIIIKIKNPESKAISRIENESNFLKILNKKKIGPKLLFYDKDYLVYEFVEGELIIDYLKNNKKINIKKIMRNIFNQLHIMDKLKINKEEMSHPIKHIIIDKNIPTMIDFERCRKTIKPGNVTQFCDFLISKNTLKTLNNKKIKINKEKIIEKAKKYKKNINKDNFNDLIGEIK